MEKRLLTSILGTLLVSLSVAACTKEPEPPRRMTNDELDRSVTAKINADASLVAYKIDVDADADKNEIKLSGSVPTESLRMKAVEAAKSAQAGLIITDKIDVKPGDVDRKDYSDDMAREARERASKSGESIGDSLDDAWVHTKVRSKLMTEGEFPGGSINVDVKSNVVTLRGSVETRDQKTKAEQAAKSIDGVKSVRNQLVIKPAR